MKQFIPFQCLQCKKITNHDVLDKKDDGKDSTLRISCRHCDTPPFTISYPKEIIEANLQENKNGNHYLVSNIDIEPPNDN